MIKGKNTDGTQSQLSDRTGHTPEPWDKPEICSGDSGGRKQHSQRIEIWAGEKLIAYYPTDFCEYGTDKENKANAERIVSCVNALAGVSNPAAVKQLIELIREATCEEVQQTGEPKGGSPDLEGATRTPQDLCVCEHSLAHHHIDGCDFGWIPNPGVQWRGTPLINACKCRLFVNQALIASHEPKSTVEGGKEKPVLPALPEGEKNL